MTAATDPSLISGATEALSSSPPHAAKGFLDAMPLFSPKFLIVIAMLVLMAAATSVFIMYLIKKRREKSTLGRAPYTANPQAWEVLKTQISQIRLPADNYESEESRRKAWTDFSSAVSLCVRRAFEIRDGLPLAEQTTQEILVFLSAVRGEDLLTTYSGLESLLRRLDEITFAGAMGGISESEAILEDLNRIISRLEQKVAYSTEDVRTMVRGANASE